MSIPQLRIKTEYSYKRVYGPAKEVAARLKDLGCHAAGIVDTHGTWGHVAWEKAMKEAGVTPLYGAEFEIPTEDGRKPRCWVLAKDLSAFYRLSSLNPTTVEEMREAKGVIRFAGAALTDPESFDYIDINPHSKRQTRRAVELHRETGKPLVITSDNSMPGPEDMSRYLAWNDAKYMTPQYILDDKEMVKHLRGILTNEECAQAIVNTYNVAAEIGALDLRKAPMVKVDETDWAKLVEEGRKMRVERGHIPEWTDEYQARLEREMELIKSKDYISYFMVVADMIVWAKERMLVGPARGSSAGSLVCYLLQITEVDPIPHNLIFERFIDLNRFDLPDIDIDFNDQKREQVFDYLKVKYGNEQIARIGSVSRLKPKSVINHVTRKLGIPTGAAFSVINVLIEHSSGDARYGYGLHDTLDTTQPGKDFVQKYPEAKLMGEIENHASHSGQHAAGIIVSNVPVVEYCTVRDGIAHIDKKDAEYLNLLKIDALGLRTLGVIEDTLCITSQELYDLKLDDPKVFEIFNDRKFSGVFQFEGAAQRRVSIQVPVDCFEKIDHVTALARPGPLGGGAAHAYIDRNAGRKEIEFRHPLMKDYLGETMGVVLYQEQVMRTCREIGKFSWEDTSSIRQAMSKSKGDEFFNRYGKRFNKGAATLGIPKDEAEEIWNEICSFGSWGMNKSHTVSYAVISYWCAYMKTYFPLEYAAACLRNAKDDVQAIEILRELRDEGVNYVPFDPDLSEASWAGAEGKLLGGYTNLVGIGPVKAARYIEKRGGKGLSDKDRQTLAKLPVKFNDLRPAHTKYGHVYDDPESMNIRGSIREFNTLEDQESQVVICQLVKQDRRDKNEAMLVNKRGYEEPGQTLFLDSFMVDDSVSQPVRVRTNPKLWEDYGEPMADRAVPGEDWFLVRGRWLEQFSMMIVQKIKCLTKPEMFE